MGMQPELVDASLRWTVTLEDDAHLVPWSRALVGCHGDEWRGGGEGGDTFTQDAS